MKRIVKSLVIMTAFLTIISLVGLTLIASISFGIGYEYGSQPGDTVCDIDQPVAYSLPGKILMAPLNVILWTSQQGCLSAKEKNH